MELVHILLAVRQYYDLFIYQKSKASVEYPLSKWGEKFSGDELEPIMSLFKPKSHTSSNLQKSHR